MTLRPDVMDDPMPSRTNPALVTAWQQRVLARQLHTAITITRDVVLTKLEEMSWNQTSSEWWSARSVMLGRLRLATEHLSQVMKSLGVEEEEK